MDLRLAIIITHPIQYFAPVFKLLAEGCNLKVFYTWGVSGANEKFDEDFGKKIKWDIPLLDGYEYEFLENNATKPGSHHFMGIQNPQIINKIRNFNPDAILIYGWAYRSHLQVLHYFSGKKPVWFRGDSTLIDKKPFWKKVARRILLTMVYGYVNKVFYVGTANKEYFRTFGIKEKQLIFAPHAVDNQRFSEDRSAEAKILRESLGLQQKDILILFAGKLEWKKNPILLFEEFIKLENPNAHLLFVGNGHLENELKERKISSGAENIHFFDFQNQTKIPILYQACDLFCLPSKTETWGLVVNEAMACGKSILVSDMVGCAIDLVKNQNGMIFKNGEELSSQLAYLLKNKETLVQMGLASKLMISNWSFKNQTEAILNQLSLLPND